MTEDNELDEFPEWAHAYLKDQDENGYVPFNKDRRLGQNQYASRYADGRHGSPDLGRGMDWDGDTSNYHFLRIHKSDLVEFHRRVMQHQDKMFGN